MGFYTNGKNKEIEFSQLVKSNEFATKLQDINEHWDVKWEGKKVDVKSLKKINRNDTAPNQNWHWIEIQNVNGGKGWLFGDADCFAFELVNYWVLVNKENLKNFVKQFVIKEYANKVPYKLYRRKNRKDIMTLINSFDLCYLSEKIIKKKSFNY